MAALSALLTTALDQVVGLPAVRTGVVTVGVGAFAAVAVTTGVAGKSPQRLAAGWFRRSYRPYFFKSWSRRALASVLLLGSPFVSEFRRQALVILRD